MSGSSQWGGANVQTGTSVKWGVVFLTVVGAPLLQVYYGIIEVVQLFGDGFDWALSGFASFTDEFFGGLLTEPAQALYSAVRSDVVPDADSPYVNPDVQLTGAWGDFLNALESWGFGPFSYLITVVATLVVLLAVVTVVDRIYD